MPETAQMLHVKGSMNLRYPHLQVDSGVLYNSTKNKVLIILKK